MNTQHGSEVFYTEGSLSVRFDVWIRRTLNYLVMTEVRSLARRRSKMAEVSIEIASDEVPPADITGRRSYGGYGSFPDPDEVAYNGEIRIKDIVEDESLRRALMELSPRKRQVINEIYGADRSLDDTADRLDLKKQTVENYKCSALKELRLSMTRKEETCDALHEKSRKKRTDEQTPGG